MAKSVEPLEVSRLYALSVVPTKYIISAGNAWMRCRVNDCSRSVRENARAVTPLYTRVRKETEMVIRYHEYSLAEEILNEVSTRLSVAELHIQSALDELDSVVPTSGEPVFTITDERIQLDLLRLQNAVLKASNALIEARIIAVSEGDPVEEE